MKMRRKGFTSIELISVLVVVSILSVMSFIVLDPYKGIKLDAAAKKVEIDIKYARSLALGVVKWHGIEFSEGPVAMLDEKVFALPLVESPAYAATVATPVMDPTSGLYTSDISVSISCSTPSANIRYTMDGSDPNQAWKGTAYTSPIPVTGSGTVMTIKARAFRDGWTRSALATETYTIQYSSTTTTGTTTSTSGTTTTTTTTTTLPSTTTTTTTLPTTTTTTTASTTSTTLTNLNQYRIYEKEGGAENTIENPANLGKLFIVNVPEVFPGVAVSSVYIPAGGGYKLEFNPLGRPYNGETGVALPAEAVITLSYKGLSREIRIAPETGRVYIP